MWRGGHCDKIIATGQLALEPGILVTLLTRTSIEIFGFSSDLTSAHILSVNVEAIEAMTPSSMSLQISQIGGRCLNMLSAILA